MVFLTLVVISIFGYIISHAVIFDEIPAGINFFFFVVHYRDDRRSLGLACTGLDTQRA